MSNVSSSDSAFFWNTVAEDLDRPPMKTVMTISRMPVHLEKRDGGENAGTLAINADGVLVTAVPTSAFFVLGSVEREGTNLDEEFFSSLPDAPKSKTCRLVCNGKEETEGSWRFRHRCCAWKTNHLGTLNKTTEFCIVVAAYDKFGKCVSSAKSSRFCIIPRVRPSSRKVAQKCVVVADAFPRL